MTNGNTISLKAIAKNAIKQLKDSPKVNKGLFLLLTAKGEQHKSIGKLIQDLAAKHPDRPFLLQNDNRYTYGEFNAWANRYAAILNERGIGKGNVVAIMTGNRPETLAAMVATVKLGGIAAMINTSQTGDVLLHSLTTAGPDVIVVDGEMASALNEIAGELPEQLLTNRLFIPDANHTAIPQGCSDLIAQAQGQNEDNPASTESIQLQDPCFYIFTSGTTGMPKASVMTHLRWHKAMAGFGYGAVRLNKDDVFYCCLPLYHNNALTVSLGCTLAAGCSLALAPKFSASNFWNDIRHYDATAFCYIGEICRYLLNQPTDKQDRDHKVHSVVGNGLRPDIWHEFKQRFDIERINEFYGASEGNLVFINSFNLDKTAGFCPLTYAIVKYDVEADEPVRDAQGHMIEVGKGETGLLISEISERAPYDGYTNEEASKKKVFHDVFGQGDQWFNTGDLVRDQGLRHIQFVDRLGDTFRWKGENVATTEVESIVNAFPQVEESVVYGVEVPKADGRAGMVALTPDCNLKDFDFAAFARHLRDSLPDYAVPLFIRIREQQETTGTFKYKKVDLKKEGFDPSLVDEPLYVLPGDADSYQPLTPAFFERIQAGRIKF